MLLQRVRQARVETRGRELGRINVGLVVLVGFSQDDAPDLPDSPVWDKMLSKLTDLRVFPDPEDKMNLSLKEWGGELLLVSQFTLYADLGKGRRPSFHLAADSDTAQGLYQRMALDLETRLPGKVRQGEFKAPMNVSLVNWGPVTVMVDSALI